MEKKSTLNHKNSQSNIGPKVDSWDAVWPGSRPEPTKSWRMLCETMDTAMKVCLKVNVVKTNTKEFIFIAIMLV